MRYLFEDLPRDETLEVMVVKIVDGIHALETFAQTALVVDSHLILIDTGVDSKATDLLKALKRIGYQPRDIEFIVITHTHPDHVGGLKTMVEKTEAVVAAHEIEIPYITRKERYPGPPGPQRHEPVDVNHVLKDSDKFEGLLVIYTPGHTPGSIALLAEEKSVLIAGDSVQNEGGLQPMDDRYNINPEQHRESIKKLAQFEFEHLIPGHGRPVIGGASQKLKELARKL